ncbi:hypothetical protein SAMN05216337_101798 [Bradyrhizobium brasilense]|uniref:Uncharacterized protein n=1 Tax=Bradyrhizobium brasilense TaxID=1419277 RepID=A0A1G6YWE7_9BRAD|nr:hypothetical protein [Bradyrhizobium brasilense]SDD93957.1 hypothetical protein SAMN05216337_101798 [Bradyrhizobium brasilense]
MIEPADTPNARRALELAVINAFFLPGSAAHVATAFSTERKKLHAGDVARIWAKAKERGDLPNITRPAKGPKERLFKLESA